jgi:hypothetical protein
LLIVVDKKEETDLEGAADLNNENGQTPWLSDSHYRLMVLSTDSHPCPAFTGPVILQNFLPTCLSELKQCFMPEGKSECFSLYWWSFKFSLIFCYFFLSPIFISWLFLLN